MLNIFEEKIVQNNFLRTLDKYFPALANPIPVTGVIFKSSFLLQMEHPVTHYDRLHLVTLS